MAFGGRFLKSEELAQRMRVVRFDVTGPVTFRKSVAEVAAVPMPDGGNRASA